ncbi:TetR family transcriptional regulator [Rouxiella silvae]|uniref:TetR family transcriptional regulator n=1 Tax=Rouxiella silvae TaxID=1646373 RepID=A0ABX3TZ80_9GAMM|nr:TetR/AcrR family transcriptional regulator [Rouxiella silvae]KQN46962.1 TetR family transcriptional regulator [Serratia sp. Leaf50]ORJ20500.1 TetR family transcriptional regulator [Rouxiella silvae]
MNVQSPTVAPKSPIAAKDRILHTAHTLFYRDGIRATGIDLIIKQAGVTKVTFYRHYSSKDALILAFLHYRHQRWMAWFSQALGRYSAELPLPAALASTLLEWFTGEDFRGCAFINSTLEYAVPLPEVRELSVTHKRDMAKAVEGYLAESDGMSDQAECVALLIDGAIVKAQMENQAQPAVRFMQHMLEILIRQWSTKAGADNE